MSFEQRIPHPLTLGAVRAYAPATAGVYGMSNAQEWLYIGLADDIQGALLEHFRNPAALGAESSGLGFVYEECSGDQRQSRLNSLVLEYAPRCNRVVVRGSQSALRKRQHAKR